MRVLAAAGFVACLSCQVAPQASGRNTPAAASSAPNADTAREEEQRRAALLARVRARLEVQLPRPAAGPRQRCPDETLATAESEPLLVRVRDERADQRQLLPLRLRERLSSASWLRLAERLAAEPGTPQGAASAADELTELERLADQRHLAELELLEYRAPKLFRRKAAPRSEWSDGVLMGRLVVYELGAPRALCQAPLEVRVSGDGQSIKRRLRDVTRERMTAELERGARLELGRALASITRAFRLEPGPDGAQRPLLAELSR